MDGVKPGSITFAAKCSSSAFLQQRNSYCNLASVYTVS